MKRKWMQSENVKEIQDVLSMFTWLCKNRRKPGTLAKLLTHSSSPCWTTPTTRPSASAEGHGCGQWLRVHPRVLSCVACYLTWQVAHVHLEFRCMTVAGWTKQPRFLPRRQLGSIGSLKLHQLRLPKRFVWGAGSCECPRHQTLLGSAPQMQHRCCLQSYFHLYAYVLKHALPIIPGLAYLKSGQVLQCWISPTESCHVLQVQ